MNFSWRRSKDQNKGIVAAAAGSLRKNAARGIFAFCALGNECASQSAARYGGYSL